MQHARRLALLLFACGSFAAARVASAAEHEFRLKKPDAQSVAVLGEFNSWTARPMTKGSDGTWRVTISLPPGTHGYKFLVNGTEWIFDPENPQRKVVDGVENSAIDAAAAAAASTPIAETQLSLTSKLTPSPTRARTSSQPTRTSVQGPAPPLTVTPGEVTTVEVPLSPTRQTQARRGGNPPVALAKVAIGVPEGFDPARTWPLLVISATANASDIELLGAYRQAALEAGWVIVAADSLEKPKEDSHSWRLAMIGGALDYLAQEWPGSAQWPIATGGFSGGAKRSGFVAASLARDGRKVIGMLLGGVNQNTATPALQEFRPPASAFRQVPIFLSSGTNDTIATPAHHENVERSMRGSGFRKVRRESYSGGHDVYAQHTSEALKWFMSQAAVPGAKPSPTSALDRFFKKP